MSSAKFARRPVRRVLVSTHDGQLTTVLHAFVYYLYFVESFFLSNVYLRWDYMFLNYTLNTVRTGCPEGHANGNRYEYRVPQGAR